MVKPFGDLVTATLTVVSAGTYAAFAEPFKSFLASTFDRSNYENADDLISYIYELQYIQQKIALTLHEFLYLVDYNEKQKEISGDSHVFLCFVPSSTSL